jgi:O-antigen/teichoic acid export membrane protein
MRRKFAANLVFLITVNMLVKPYFIFGIDRVVQNRVGPDEYGVYFAVLNYSFLLSIILDFGIQNFNNRAISRDRRRLGEYLLNLTMIKFFLSIVYLALTFLAAWATGYGELKMKMLFYLAINQILLSIILYFRSNVAALQMFKTDSILSTLDKLLAIVFCLIIIYVPYFKQNFDIMWFIYAQTAGLFITAIISLLVVMGRTVIKLKLWKPKFTRMILLKSAPFAMLTLLMGIYYRIDAVMIERMLPNGDSEAGIYAASFRLLDSVNQFGYLFSTLLLPMFASMIRRNESMQKLVKFSSELMFVVAIITAVDCYFFRNEIMILLYNNSTSYWSLIFGWLMINFVPMSSIYIFGTLLTANGSLKVLNFIALGGMVINVSLNFYLIPHYGALGATIATLITQIFAALAHIYATHRKFGFSYEVRDIIKFCIFTVSCCLALYLIKMSGYSWIINFLIASSVCCILAAVTNLIPISEFFKLLRSKSTS